jgi:uncharacterized protein
MIVAVVLFELHIEFAQSLKEKRMVVRSLKDKLRRRFNLSVNEVAFQDLHQRTRIALSLVADRRDNADSVLDTVQMFVESHAGARVMGWTVEKLDFDEEADL